MIKKCPLYTSILYQSMSVENLYSERCEGTTHILTGFHGKACRGYCMSGHHPHKQVVNPLGKDNLSWATVCNVCTSRHSR